MTTCTCRHVMTVAGRSYFGGIDDCPVHGSGTHHKTGDATMFTTTAGTMDEWLISDSMGEYVEYYNPTGHVMVFTRDRDKAMKTTCSENAYDIARIAQTIYGRKSMRMGMAS